MLSPEAQDFIETSPFLFIATRAGNGRIDVSPRGDIPSVLAVRSASTLILPDRPGNNRLDTIGNMLDQPRICLAVLSPGSDRFLRIRARSAVSVAAEDRQPFEIRGQLPLSVARLTVDAAEFIVTRAFRDAQFWSPSSTNHAPLDLFGIIKNQLAYHTGQGIQPEPQRPLAHPLLERNGLAGAYEAPSHYVQRKSFAAFDPHTVDFLAACRFAALAFCDHEGELDFAMLGGEQSFASARNAREFSARGRTTGHVSRPQGLLGGLFIRPGMPESLRLNGRIAHVATSGDDEHILVETSEMFLHCSNSFIRSRIWRPRLAWNGKREFFCRERVEEAHGVASFLLAPVDDAPLESFHAGQYVTVSGPEGAERPPERCYSLSGVPTADHFRITVKRHDRGQVSRWLHDEIKPGNILMLGAPRGRFRLDADSPRNIALVSAGAGVTPVMSMLHHLASTAQNRPVWFIHGARNGREHSMHDQVRAIARSHPAIHTHFAYSRPDAHDRPGGDYDQQGRIDIAMLAQLLDLRATDFYLCGPNDFMISLKRGLLERHVPESQIRMEIFGATPGARRSSDAPPATVTLSRTGAKLAWTPADGSLLDLVLSKGIDAPYVCRRGDCQSCAQRLIAGDVAYPAEADVETPQGYVLVCQATPLGDISIDL